MVSIADLMLPLAGKVAKQHGLNTTTLMALANTLEQYEMNAQKTSVQYVPFSKLVDILSDVNEDIPEWLAASETQLLRYSEADMDLIIQFIETRFWRGDLERHMASLWLWNVVFGAPRQDHRVMADKAEVQDAKNLIRGSHRRFTFMNIISEKYYDDYGPGYKTLRAAYFPSGIDYAIEGFVMHYRQIKKVIRKLRKRCCFLLEDKGIDVETTLISSSLLLAAEAAEMLDKMMKVAIRWNHNTKRQKEYFQLPGVSLGLQYGEKVYVDYDMDVAYVNHLLQNGSDHWDSHGPVHTPVRWLPGTPWRDWLHNVKQPQPAISRQMNYKCRGKRPYEDNTGPYEFRLPQNAWPLLLHFARLYFKAEEELDEAGNIEGPKKTKEELCKQSKRLARATGLDYWRTRKIQKFQGAIEMMFHVNPLLNGRPRFDGMNNLRFDYMGAILQELTTGHRPVDHRPYQSLIIDKGV